MTLSYLVSVTGDCLNISAGALYVEPIGGTSPYIIDWQVPALGTDVSVTSSTKTGLAFGTYQILITDSSVSPNSLYGLLSVSSGVCLDVSSTNTSCGLDNGSVLAYANTSVISVDYFLYSLSGGYVTSATSLTGFNIFTPLSSDTYYVEATDEGGCSGRSSTTVVANSNTFDYGFFVVDNSRCSGPSGKIYITGQTGTSPYTYLWSTNEMTSSISGLNAGNYSVIVTDSYGCQITKSVVVKDVDPPSVLTIIPMQPDCFQSNGELSVFISGGTPPYYYLLSNGDSVITYSTNQAFTGLSNGLYNVYVTDAGLCTTSGTTTLSTPNSFNIIGVSSIPSNCGLNNGAIVATVGGGNSPYTYTLTDYLGNDIIQSTTSTNVTFSSLPSGNYHLKITNPSYCSYETDVNVVNSTPFILSTSSTETTCGLNNGSIVINVNTGGTYTYEIHGRVVTTTLTSQTFSNLSSGVYNVSATNSDGCRQTTQVIIGGSNPVQFSLIDTNCGVGNEGSITAIITNGQPPFTLNWSQNVNSQTGIYVTGLTAGTYTLNVVDDNDCSLTQSTQILCGSVNTSYLTYNICDSIFTETTGTKTGFQQMLNQGFQDLTVGEISCKLVLAQFNLLLNVGSSAFTNNFFTTTTLSQYPTDQQYVDALNSLLSGITGIGSIVLNPDTNTVSINTDCARTLSADTISIGIRIDYNVCCFQEPTPTPTPSITPTLTPTPEVTPTPTLTPTSSPAPLSIFRMYANDLTGAYIRQIISTSTYYIDWGDGNIDTYGAGNNLNTEHYYSGGYSPYTGEIKILAYDLGNITRISTDNRIGTGGTNPSLLIVGSELYKLSGLTYFGNVQSTFTGNTTEIPIALQTLYSLRGKVSGDINNLPKTLTYLTLNENNDVSGNIANFPSGMTHIEIAAGTNTINGDIKDVPSGVTYFALYGRNTVSGNTSDIQPSNTVFYLYGYNTLVGDIANIPNTNLRYFAAYGYNSLSGDVVNISGKTLYTFVSANDDALTLCGNTITGDIKYLPKMLNTVEIRGYNTVYGDIANMPTGSTPTNTTQYFNVTGRLPGGNTISGDASNISTHISDFILGGRNILSGNTSSFPSNIKVMDVTGDNTITGDIANLPPNAYFIDIEGNNTVRNYTQGRSWAANMNQLTIFPSSSSNYITTTEIDNLFNDLTGTTWSNSPRFGQSYITLVGTASTASQAARNKLSGATPGGYGVVITLT